MEHWVWQGIAVSLPADWEMLQYSCNPEKGRCAFADRYQFRFELDWLAVESAPDVARAVSDYQARLEEEGAERAEAVRCGDWQGLVGRQEGGSVSRFLRHLAELDRFVEVVFVWSGKRDTGLERQVLRTVRPEPADDSDGQQWRAFGMELVVSPGLTLERCTVRPADAEMVFTSKRGRNEERFARRGMVSDWLHGSTGDWLRDQCPASASLSRERSVEHAGHRVLAFNGELRGPGVFRRRRTLQTAAWVCPADRRLYSVARTSPESPAADDPALLAGSCLRCCGRLPSRVAGV